MSDAQYQDIDLVAFYDQLNPLGQDSDYFLGACAPARHTVLDLGCGTGLLAAALAARGHAIVGVEPAEQMLQVARKREPGGSVTWIQADARQLDLPQRFDRVIATGHVFQVFTSEADQLAFLTAAARHLNPGGSVIFDTRNPLVTPWQNWTPHQSRRRIEHPAHGRIDIWHEVMDSDSYRVRFRTTYRFTDQDRQMTSDSDLAFPTVDMVKMLLDRAGLDVSTLHGGWDGVNFTNASAEIIITARRIGAGL